MNQKRNVIYYLILSVAGVVLLLAVVWLESPNIRPIGLFEKLFVGGAFITSCILGISMTLRPNWIRRLSRKGVHGLLDHGLPADVRRFEGHHPDCEAFRGHVIVKEDRVLCAGCTSLALGCGTCIVLMIVYTIIPIGLPPLLSYILIAVGMILIMANYVEIVIPTRNTMLHRIFNIVLIIGLWLVVVSVFELTGNIVLGLFGIVLSFLWLDTRIQLSNWQHVEICRSCGEACKAY